jgi:hypothetical protein
VVQIVFHRAKNSFRFGPKGQEKSTSIIFENQQPVCVTFNNTYSEMTNYSKVALYLLFILGSFSVNTTM